jgi:hypothetical protein
MAILHVGPQPTITAADVPIALLDNDSLIVQLHFTINHLSRWLTPIHNQTLLQRKVYRDMPTVRELVVRMRDEELRVFPKIFLIATEQNPDLDKLPPVERSIEEQRWDEYSGTLSVLAEFRRLRQSTASLLRSIPDSAWKRVGTSRLEHDWQLRSLAEVLANHDRVLLAEIDRTLDAIGARDGISDAAKAHLEDLLKITPVTLK